MCTIDMRDSFTLHLSAGKFILTSLMKRPLDFMFSLPLGYRAYIVNAMGDVEVLTRA